MTNGDHSFTQGGAILYGNAGAPDCDAWRFALNDFVVDMHSMGSSPSTQGAGSRRAGSFPVIQPPSGSEMETLIPADGNSVDVHNWSRESAGIFDAVAEPSTLALVAIGLAGIILARTRRIA